MVDFKVTLRVTASRLPTVLEALSGSAHLISVLPCEGGEEPAAAKGAKTRKAPAGPYYVNGKRNKGISGQQLALQSFQRASGSLTTAQLAKIFEAQGFSPSSNSPAIAALAQAGLVERVELGRWKITEKGKGAQL